MMNITPATPYDGAIYRAMVKARPVGSFSPHEIRGGAVTRFLALDDILFRMRVAARVGGVFTGRPPGFVRPGFYASKRFAALLRSLTSYMKDMAPANKVRVIGAVVSHRRTYWRGSRR